jgi:hypothetical protein
MQRLQSFQCATIFAGHKWRAGGACAQDHAGKGQAAEDQRDMSSRGSGSLAGGELPEAAAGKSVEWPVVRRVNLGRFTHADLSASKFGVE